MAGELTAHAVARLAAAHPTRIAVVDADQPAGAGLSYAELHRAALRWAHALERAGAAPGECVAVMLPTTARAFTVQLGVAWLGGTAVSLNVLWRGALLRRALTITGSTVLVTTRALYAQVAALGAPPPALRSIVLLDTGAVCTGPGCIIEGDPVDHTGGVPAHDADVLLADCEPRPRAGPLPDQIQGIIFTSGTTGPSKPVRLSHEFFLACARGLIPRGVEAGGGAFYSPWPMGHSLGSLALAASVHRGVRLVLRDGFTVDSFRRDVREHDCASAVLVTVAHTLWAAPRAPDDAANPLRWVAMSPLIREHRAFARRFGVRVSGMYGMTEIGPVLTSVNPDDHRVAGRPAPGYVCRVAGPDGVALPDGLPGELLVRPSPPRPGGLMSGYAGMPEETARALRGGWFHTGDLFLRRPDGEFLFMDRLKDAIRRRGRNISSFEIEVAAAEHPGVAQCAAVGVPSDIGSSVPRADEEVKLFVVRRPGTPLTAAELVEFLAARVPGYMVPRFVELADGLPTGSTRRPMKSVLRELPNTEATFDRLRHPPSAPPLSAARRPPGSESRSSAR